MKICIIGLGSMGLWFYKKLVRDNEIICIEKDIKKLHKAGISPGFYEDLPVFNPEIILNCCTIDKSAEVFRECSEYISEKTILADIMSRKGEIGDYYKSIKNPFLSMHPMFGPGLIDILTAGEANCIFINNSDERAADFFKNLFRKNKINNFFNMSFTDHDELMALSLSTPFLSTIAFAGGYDRKTVPGTTFNGHKRLAQNLFKEDISLICEVLFNPETVLQLEKMTSSLEYLKHIIRDRDKDTMSLYLTKLKENIVR